MPPKRKRTDDSTEARTQLSTAATKNDINDIRSLLISLNEKVSGMQRRQDEMKEDIKEIKSMKAVIDVIKDKVESMDEVISLTPLWKLITDHPDVFEKHVLKSGYLNGSDIKMFYEVNTESRDAVKRAKIELKETFRVDELSSISTLKLAWEGYQWGARMRLPSGEGITVNQEVFCSRVAETNDLKLLRWVREEKECDWDYKTSGMAAIIGNLDMLKYCCENGCEVHDGTCAEAAKYGNLDCLKYLRSKNCPWNSWVCKDAHENNHIDVLTYAVRNKCPGFEEYEQFIPK